MAKTVSIAIDGPAGAGKSTIARALAAEFGYRYVDTGAIYRTVAYFLDILGISPKDVDGVNRYLDELTIGVSYDDAGVQHMLMNGMDVTDEIRTQEIGQKASVVSAQPPVRALLLDMQRQLAREYNVIMDGRDIGTVVLPKADLKLFLTATPEVRAQRRRDQLAQKGKAPSPEKVLAEIRQRDERDSTRAIAPLKKAADAVELDTSALSLEQTLERIRALLQERGIL